MAFDFETPECLQQANTENDAGGACDADYHSLLRHAYLPIVSTALNLTLPVIIRSYAWRTSARGNISIIARKPLNAANLKVSSESMDVPELHPLTERPESICMAVSVSGSDGIAITTTLPSGVRPSTRSDIALPLGPVAITALAHPSSLKRSATLSPSESR